jgi:hypothetical protein
MSTTGEASTSSNNRSKRVKQESTPSAAETALVDATYHTLYTNQISSKHILFRLSPEDIANMALLSKRALDICCQSTLFKDLLRCFFPYANVPFAKDSARNREAVLVFIQLARRRRADPELLRVFLNSRGTMLYVGAVLRVQTHWPLPETRMKYLCRRELTSEIFSDEDTSSSSSQHDDDDDNDTNFDPELPTLCRFDGSFDDDDDQEENDCMPLRRLTYAEIRQQKKEDAFFDGSDVEDNETNTSTPSTFVKSGCYSDVFSHGGFYMMPVKFLNFNLDAMQGFADVRNDFFVCYGEGPGGSGMAFNVSKMGTSIDFGPDFNKNMMSLHNWENKGRFCDEYMIEDKGFIDSDGNEISPVSTGGNIRRLELHRLELYKLVHDKLNLGKWNRQTILTDLRAEFELLSMDTEDKKLYLIGNWSVLTVDMSDENRFTYKTNELSNAEYRMTERAFISGPLYVDTNRAGIVVTTIDFRNINAAGKIVVHRYHTRPVPGRRSFSRLVRRSHYPTLLLEYKEINGFHYPQFLSRPMPWEDRVLSKHK